MRGSMLVPRAMRSSIPSPRTFVLVRLEIRRRRIQNIDRMMVDEPKSTYSCYNQEWQDDQYGG